jgi:hypothetical protein
MKYLKLFVLMCILVGCGKSQPSEAEIARGIKTNFIRQNGASDGRWSVELTAERYGQRRTLNATAVMDKNGDIHYYTD